MASVPSNMIRGVRIACDWDVENLKFPKYTAVDVAKDDPVFDDCMIIGGDPFTDAPYPSSPISPLSELVGLPFRVRKIPPNRSLPGNDVTKMQDENATSRYGNQEGAFLMKEMDPRGKLWNWAPEFWDKRVGNVLITRVDGKPIKPQQVEALSAYIFYLCDDPMQMAWEQHKKGEEQVRLYQKVIDEVTPAKFKEFCGYYKSFKEERRRNWKCDEEPVVMTSKVTA